MWRPFGWDDLRPSVGLALYFQLMGELGRIFGIVSMVPLPAFFLPIFHLPKRFSWPR